MRKFESPLAPEDDVALGPTATRMQWNAGRRAGPTQALAGCPPCDPAPPPLSTDGIERLLRRRSIAARRRERAEASEDGVSEESPGCANSSSSNIDFAAAVEQSGLKISHEFGMSGVWEHEDGRSGVFAGDPAAPALAGAADAAVRPKLGGWKFSQTRNARPTAEGDGTAGGGAWRPRGQDQWEVMCDCCGW